MCVNFFKVSSFDFGVIRYYYIASSTVVEMCKQSLCKICCQAAFCLGKEKVALLETLKVSFQGELHIQ